MRRLLLALFCTCLLVAPASARLGDTLSKLKERYGKPQPQGRKDAAVWFFETEGEKQLILAVTFNAQGVSIAEGLKPMRYARLSAASAQVFIDVQLAPLANSPTLLRPKPGEKYLFAGQAFTCGEQEVVFVDNAKGVLLLWNQGDPASVMALSAEMFKS